MAKKTYYISYGDFANIYDLAWADNAPDRKYLCSIGFERCSRKEAERKARAERDRRLYDKAFSGYADAEIHPAQYYMQAPEVRDTWLIRNYELNGVIWE